MPFSSYESISSSVNYPSVLLFLGLFSASLFLTICHLLLARPTFCFFYLFFSLYLSVEMCFLNVYSCGEVYYCPELNQTLLFTPLSTAFPREHCLLVLTMITLRSVSAFLFFASIYPFFVSRPFLRSAKE